MTCRNRGADWSVHPKPCSNFRSRTPPGVSHAAGDKPSANERETETAKIGRVQGKAEPFG